MPKCTRCDELSAVEAIEGHMCLDCFRRARGKPEWLIKFLSRKEKK